MDIARFAFLPPLQIEIYLFQSLLTLWWQVFEPDKVSICLKYLHTLLYT